LRLTLDNYDDNIDDNNNGSAALSFCCNIEIT